VVWGRSPEATRSPSTYTCFLQPGFRQGCCGVPSPKRQRGRMHAGNLCGRVDRYPRTRYVTGRIPSVRDLAPSLALCNSRLIPSHAHPESCRECAADPKLRADCRFLVGQPASVPVRPLITRPRKTEGSVGGRSHQEHRGSGRLFRRRSRLGEHQQATDTWPAGQFPVTARSVGAPCESGRGRGAHP